MKKRSILFVLLLAFVTLLAIACAGAEECTHPTMEWKYDDTTHWLECTACGTRMNEGEHYANCANPNQCEECGADNIMTENVYHEVNEDWEYDASQHWKVCKLCGEKALLGPHYDMCTTPGVCDECGAQGVDFAYTEHPGSWEAPYEHDDIKHWKTCSDCGERVNENDHYGNCVNPNQCLECGANDVTIAGTGHNAGDKWYHDGATHWQICNDCGEKVYESEHYELCTTPGVCSLCEATGVTFAGRSHTWSEWNHDDTTHWQICARCGEKVCEGGHWASCTNQDVCLECGASGITANYDHNAEEWQHDGTTHWQICVDCGERFNEGEHFDCCMNPGACVVCDANDVNFAYTEHYFDDKWEHDDTTHWLECTVCGKKESEYEHYASCVKPDVCVKCCASGVEIAGVEHVASWDEPYEHDADRHWKRCPDCNQIVNEGEHLEFCMDPGVCLECGASNVVFADTFHNIDENNWEHDSTKHWAFCLDCHEKVCVEYHWDSCMTPGVCVICGVSDAEMAFMAHDWNEWEHDDETHWGVCKDCHQKDGEGEHWAWCTDPDVCANCGAKAADGAKIACIEHEAAQDTELLYDDMHHWQYCADCGKNVYVEDHTWIVTSENATEWSYACELCGATKTESLETPTPAPHVHSWIVDIDTQASCTEDGARKTHCTGCGLTTDIQRPALGHDFAYTALGDGTHTRTCKRCGLTETGACNMAENDLEAVRSISCTECGYTVYMVQTVEMPAEVQVAMAPVEDAAVELPTAEEGSFELVIHETNTALAESVAQAMEQLVTAALPENTPVTVKKLLNVTMLVENEIVQPGAKLRLTLSCDMDMTNMRLMLLRDNGELIEIEYEVIDGKLVFETEHLGLFLFVENKAA